MFDLPAPNVKTKFKIKEYNCSLIIIAYRKVTKNEARHLLNQYLAKHHLKHPPRNKIIKCQSIHGFDLE